MPRDGAGTYTLPAGNPVVTSTTISSSWANTTLNDIATALTDSLAINGSVTTAKLATDAFTTAKIADLSVTAAKLDTGSVTAVKLATDAVTTDKILDGAVTVDKLAPGVEGTAAVTGTIMIVGMSTPPTGWLKCDGAAVSRTTYSALFSAIGTTFGAGDGSTTFNVPELRGEFARGWDDGRGVDTARVFGSSQAEETTSHTHTASSGGVSAGHTHEISATSDNNSVSHTHVVSINTGTNSVGHTHTFSGTANSAGAHTHTFLIDNTHTGGPQTGIGSSFDPTGTTTTSSAGAHTHTISSNTLGVSANHTHTVSGTSATESSNHTHLVSGTSGSNSATHTHVITINAAGGAETRPRNIALLYVIKT
jgi:microcystin-dependent protein